MLHARRRRRLGTALVAVILTGGIAGCTRGGPTVGTPVRLDEPERTAASFSFPYYTDLVVEGDRVAAAFMTLNGPQDRNVVVRQSDDGGATWSPAFVLNAPEYGDTISVAPRLVRQPGGVLLAAWQARRNRSGQKFILTRRSADFGRSWGPIQVLNSAFQSFPPSVAARDDGTVLVVFSDERNVGRDIFANRSGDGGASWLPKDVLVETTPRTESIGPWPALGPGSDAWVIWEEKHRGEPQIQVSRSRDGGLTWGPPVRVDPKEQEASPIWPVIVESAGRLTAVWTAGVVGDRLRSWLFAASSTDGGATWGAPAVLYEGPAQAVFHLVAQGSSLYLVWNAGGSDGGIGVYFNASDDGGATWRLPLDAPQRIDAAGPKTPAGRPRVAVAPDGGTVAVVWQEEEKRIALRASRDGGRTWPSAPVTIASADKSRVRFPIVTADASTAWVLWEEWADMTGVRKTLADVEKATPLDVYVTKVELP